MSSVTPAFAEPPSEHLALAQGEVVDLCRDLLRIDTSNFGDDSGPGERRAAEYVAAQLEDVGLPATIVEGTPGRTNVITRIAGADPTRPALLLHGHLDVVPAQAADWQVDPFAGEIRDDFLWGRGAVDMKDMVAMILALGRDLARSGRRPPRDLVLAFLADEEAGGNHGAGWLVQHRPELFEGVSEAVSEVGGFSIDLTTKQGDPQRAYLLQTAEKGIAWLRLVAHGRAGHGSVINDDNAVTRLAAAVARIGTHRWPTVMTDAVGQLLAGMSQIVGEPLPAEDFGALYRAIGTTAVFVGATVRNTSNPTGLQAGYKHNVIPGQASAMIDCRFVPGQEQALLDTVRELAGPNIDVEVVQQAISLEVPFSGSLVEAMKESLLAEDPGAAVLPYCLSGGTDNKSFAELGITGYGFAPLRLPAGIDFAGMFHGIDERVPLDGLRFGVRVLDRFVAAS
jgi:acetylornithine deacetylase/succinyl-diaminopimelate desuccinylase-like protein